MSDPNDRTDPSQGAAPGGGHDEKGTASFTEEFKVSGEAVLGKIKELVREGNVRRISIKNDDGRTLIEIPLTIGVIGTVLLPVWAAIGAIAALAANLTIAVERPGTRPANAAEASATHPSSAEPASDSAAEPPTGV